MYIQLPDDYSVPYIVYVMWLIADEWLYVSSLVERYSTADKRGTSWHHISSDSSGQPPQRLLRTATHQRRWTLTVSVSTNRVVPRRRATARRRQVLPARRRGLAEGVSVLLARVYPPEFPLVIHLQDSFPWFPDVCVCVLPYYSIYRGSVNWLGLEIVRKNRVFLNTAQNCCVLT